MKVAARLFFIQFLLIAIALWQSATAQTSFIDNGAPDIALDVNSSRLSIVVISADPDGAGDFSYDWQKKDRGETDWTTVSTTATYWLPSGASGSVRYRVNVEHTDGQGNESDLQEPFILTPFRADIDDDDDGLIEIYYLEDLDAVRHSLDGSGYKASAAADLVTDGCAEGGNGMCRGYELATNLDFNDARSYTDSDNNQANWTANDKRKNAGWVPLGILATTLEGNGYTISNLYINSRSVAGLFRASNVSINNVGLLDVDIRGGDPRVGGLMGNNAGRITGSHVTGNVTGTKNIGMLAGRNNSTGEIINSYASGNVTGTFRVGGLVGDNRGVIANSYAINKSAISRNNIAGGLVGANSGQITNTYAAGTVNAPGNAGGLLGTMSGDGTVKYSYTISTVTGSQAQVGGLVAPFGFNPQNIVASYWDSSVYERAVPPDDGRVRTTAALQSPTSATGIYSKWSSKNWDFGDENSYPALRYGVGDEDNPACDEDDATHLPRCGFLLSGQPGRDRGLNAVFFLFADEEIAAKIDPSFSTVVFDYDVTIPDPDTEITKYIATLQLRPYTINDATTIAITNEADVSEQNYFVGKESGDTSDLIRLDDNTTITIAVTDTIDEGIVNTTYTLAINRLVLPLEISAIKVSSDSSENADDSINEGSKISFAVKASGGRGDYEYALQIADNPQLPFQQNLPLEFKVAEDLLGTNVTTQNHTFKVIVRSGDLITSQTEVLTIRKIDNGTPGINLDINPSRLSIIATGTDPDGAGDFSYDWQKRDRGEADWTTVATTATYWLPNGASGSIRYRVNVEHTDGQGYEADYSQVPFILTPFRADIDEDDDGLIEIYYLEDLDAVRYSLDGSGYQASAAADLVTVGCDEDGDESCSGYELATNLDFNDVQSYTNSDNQANWTANDDGTASWVPIGTSSAPLAAILEGNGYTISNLYINFTGKNAGLFGVSSVSINNIGLLDVDIRSNGNTVGGLASINDGKITDSYATGQVEGRNNLGLLVGLNSSTGEIINSYVRGRITGNGTVGGMVGDNRGAIANSYARNKHVMGSNTVGGLVGSNTGGITNTYATGTVVGSRMTGGLAGILESSGVIEYSYTISTVSGPRNQIGGLVASIADPVNIVASYWDSDVSSSPSNNDRARTTEALQSPTTATGIYSDWSDDDWDFGDASSYPALRYGVGDENDPACDEDDATHLPPCGVLLSGQQGRRGLAGIFFLSNNKEIAAKVVPSFSTVMFDYDVTIPDPDAEITKYIETLQLKPRAINDAATIMITKAGDVSNRDYFVGKASGDTSDPIMLDDTTITIVVTDTIDEATVNTTYTLAITRFLPPLQISAIKVSSDSSENADDSINEGSEISFTVVAGGGRDNYEYALQIADNPQLPFQQNLPLKFKVAEDLLGTDVTTQNYTFKVIVSDGVSTTSRTEVLTIRKIDNGTPDIAISVEPSRLSIIATGTDPDGAGEFSYDWQKKDRGEANWTTVATTATYWLPSGASGSIRYRVDVRYTDGQGNEADYSQVPFILTPFRADIDDDDDGLIEIYYLEDLDLIREQFTDMPTTCGARSTATCTGFELRRSLDFQEASHYVSGQIRSEWTTEEGWVPIDTLDAPFEGNGFTISNLYINFTGNNAGLFGVSSASINNIGLLDVDIRGNTTVGGLASLNNGKITDSYVTGQVEGQNNVGLLIGRNSRTGEIINSYVRGSVEGDKRVGGLAGNNQGAITNSYARNNQVMGDDTVGGLVGSNTGGITDTYATGTVEGMKKTGGLAGELKGIGVIKYSYTISTVSGPRNQIGGLVASIIVDNIVASYWDSDVYADSDVSSSPSSNDRAKTTADLQSPTTATGIYSAWSSKNWDFGSESSYPTLRYGVGTDEDNPACDTDDATPLPPCGVLLSGQQGRRGLAGIFFLFADEEITAKIDPSFSTAVFDYDVTIPDPDAEITKHIETLQLKPRAINDAATITITKAGDASNRDYFAGKASGDTSDPIRLADNTTITIVVADKIDEATVNTTYTLAVTLLMPLQISAITVGSTPPKNADNTINEGSEISFAVEASGGRGNYEYALQIADDPQLLFQQNLPLEFEVAEDLLGTDVTTQNYTFKVIVSDGVSTTSRTEVVTIRKIDNGTPAITLDVNSSRLSIIATGTDPDGAGEFSYDWQKKDRGEDWMPVSMAATYQIPSDASGSIRYRVDVGYTDGQGNEADYSQVPFILTPFRADIDDDDDGLIEIYYLEDLDAVRYNLDGSGYQASADADLITVGCDEDGDGSCSGYELAAGLDFNDVQSYTDSDNLTEWSANGGRTNAGWEPLGALDATLEGNGFTISNLYINFTGNNAGLFGVSSASINNISLLDVDIRGNQVGGLASLNDGKITDSYVTGEVEGRNNVGLLVGRNGSTGEIINSYVRGSITGNRTVGGLVGDNRGAIANSYALNNQVTGANTVGGLVGANTGGITNTYATGAVDGRRAGGLAGTLGGSGMIEYSYTISTVSGNQIGGLVASIADSDNIVASYWDSDVSTSASNNDRAKTTADLRSPTEATGIYSEWSSENWDFGDDSSYPTLRYGEGNVDDPACDSDDVTILPQCGVLLSGQQGRDRGLAGIFFLSEDEELTVRVDRPFSTVVFDYAVTIPDSDIATLQLKLHAINDIAGITVSKQGDATDENYFADKENGETSNPIMLDDDTTITIVVADTIVGDTVNTTYTLVVTRLMPLQISAITVPPKNADNTINEGSELSIRPEVSGGSGNYEYALQTADNPSLSFQPNLPLTLDIAEDFVDAGVPTQDIMLKVIVRDGGVITSRTEVVTIKKIDNGAATFDTTLTVNGSQLSVAAQNISDEDGVGAFTYQWQKRNVNSGWQGIMNATAADYTVPPTDSNDTRYRVQVTHTDVQGYEDTVLEGPFVYRSDVDADDDGLIEIYYLEDLDAVRYQPDGSGYKASASVAPITEGCDDGTGNCSGYELATNLDFKDALSYTDNDNMAKWTANGDTNRGWVPIDSLATTFNGNGYTISNLYINSTAAAGLFSGSSGSINDVGLLDVDVRGTTRVGGLTGTNTGKITNSYVTGRVVGHSLVGMLVGFNSGGEIYNSYVREGSVTGSLTVVGGLVGGNSGKITNTYAAVTVTGQRSAGGLVGAITGAGIVKYSYTIGTVMGPQDQVGGLAASVPNADNIVASYWDSDVYADSNVPLPPTDATSRTTAALQSPTDATGIYSKWSGDDWNFGDASSYPALRYGVGDENNPACDEDDATALPRCGFLLPGQPGRDGGLDIERTISAYIKIFLEGLLR